MKEAAPRDRTMPAPARFGSKVAACQQAECSEWMGERGKGGYGRFYVKGKNLLAHRYAYELHHGPIPPGLLVLHRCDNRACVNPAHLFLGTHKDNTDDMCRKGRQAKGDRSGARTHPDRIPRGERHGSRTHPERLPRGDQHPARLHPERCARGDRNSARTHPERVPRGEAVGNAKLKEQQVIEIMNRWLAGESLAQLAQEFRVHFSTVHRIVTEKTWAHLFTGASP